MSKQQKLNQPEAAALYTLVDPRSPIAERYRTIRTNIQYASFERPTKSIVMTSAQPSEGKSTAAANLAVAFAQAGFKTILVDADLRRPTAHLTFDLSNHTGLSNLLDIKTLSVNDVVQNSGIPDLEVITSGLESPYPSELLASNRMRKLIHVLDQMYDFVIFDLPPISAVTDAQLIAAHVDGVVLSVREGYTHKDILKESVSLLNKVGANIIGTIYIGDTNNKDYYYYTS